MRRADLRHLAVRLKYYNFWFFLAPAFLVAASALYSKFTPDTPAAHWAGFQVIQGVAAGFGMQMSSLVVQLELKDSDGFVPVGIALVSFLQYLGSSVTQVIAGAIFNQEVRLKLAAAGLSPDQTAILLQGGTRGVRDVVQNNFPEQMAVVLGAYNAAITKAFVGSLPALPRRPSMPKFAANPEAVCPVGRLGCSISLGVWDQMDKD